VQSVMLILTILTYSRAIFAYNLYWTCFLFVVECSGWWASTE